MINVYPNLYVGTNRDCFEQIADMAIIHACKEPCHRNAVGYRGNLAATHPAYLKYQQDDQHLYLNIVDIDQELQPRYTDPIMQEAIRFIEKNISARKVLVHCNWGMSRSPSIALLYMARVGAIDNLSYSAAQDVFKTVYAAYRPGNGIATYLENNWSRLLNL